jgi:predicted ribosome quality control (RQC) complex YloA/Tae2 family protein
MLSLCELRRAARILQEELPGATLRRVTQTDECALVLTFEKSRGKVHLLLSCDPEHARICRVAPPVPAAFSSSFCEYTRSHLIGGSLSEIEAPGRDRQLGFRLQLHPGLFVLTLSILGKRSNVYVVDADGKLSHSMRPLDRTRRELRIGEPWTNPVESIRSEGVDRWENVPDEQYLEAIGTTYRQLEQRHEAELLARRIEHAVRKERTFLDRKSSNLQEDLGEARQAEVYRHKGELLKNVLHTIKPGDAGVIAADYQTGEVFEIALDPKLSPVANMESYFDRYQKGSRGVKMIQQQLENVESSQVELDAIEQRLLDALRGEPCNIPALEELASQTSVRRLIHRYFPRERPGLSPVKSTVKKGIPPRLLPKRYKTPDGLEIWVGRNDEGNDFLTTRLARGNDLFFHLEGYPGSHVVLRTEGRPNPPSDALLDACELAVHFSRLKNAGSADVHVAPIKNVKKPRGVKPGLVYVRGGKTIRLRHDPKRLQSILSSRLD